MRKKEKKKGEDRIKMDITYVIFMKSFHLVFKYIKPRPQRITLASLSISLIT